MLKGWRLTDLAVLLLVITGIVASLLAEYQHVALRELRVVILEAVVLYVLIRTQRWNLPALARLIDVLFATSVLVALYSLVRYASPEGVIAAEGVRRARGLLRFTPTIWRCSWNASCRSGWR